MNLLLVVLFILALICFALSAVGAVARTSKVNFQSLGLFFLAAALFFGGGPK